LTAIIPFAALAENPEAGPSHAPHGQLKKRLPPRRKSSGLGPALPPE